MENEKITFNFNDRVYKTLDAAKRARTIYNKRMHKESKKVAYAASEKKVKRDKTLFTKKLSEILNKKAEQAKIKTFHITGLVEQTVYYKNKYAKNEGYKKEQLIRDSQIIEAKDIETAKEKFRDNATMKFSSLKIDDFSGGGCDMASFNRSGKGNKDDSS